VVKFCARLLICLIASGCQFAGEAPRNAAPGVRYVGSKVCAGCHRGIYDEYMRTPMGRSLAALRGKVEPQHTSTRPVRIASATPNRFYEVESGESGLYQSDVVVDAQGKEIYRKKYKLEYMLGSGLNGSGYLVKRGSYLCEAPLSYYTQHRGWGLSPGYEHDDSGFTRPIQAGCIFCHSGRPQPVSNRPGLFQSRPFQEEAIGCENCHGPGELHAFERGKSAVASKDTVAASKDGDPLILNPARLPARLAEDICMNCHQGGDGRALMPGKNYADFRPGTALAETYGLFKVPAKPETSPESDTLEHHFAMKFSKCFMASGGKLSCMSCHDPHKLPPDKQKTAYYREKCLSCHRDQDCTITRSVRLDRNQDDCAGCHMMKRDLTTFSHSALTNHRITRKPGEPYPESAYQLTTADLPDLVYVNRPEGAVPRVPAVTLLSVYESLAPADLHYRERFLALLLRLLNEGKISDPSVLETLAREAQRDTTPEGDSIAIRYFAKAIQAGPAGWTAFAGLGDMLLRAGRAREAAEVLEKGIAEFPFQPGCYRLLLDAYTALHQQTQFDETARKYLDLFPADSGVRARNQSGLTRRPGP